MNATKCFLVLCLSALNEINRSGNKSVVNAKDLKVKSTEGTIYSDLLLTRKAANEEAKRLAALEPTKIFAVFETVGFFETSTPEVLEKVFDDHGQFVLKMTSGGEARRA